MELSGRSGCEWLQSLQQQQQHRHCSTPTAVVATEFSCIYSSSKAAELQSAASSVAFAAAAYAGIFQRHLHV
jgi:hypothetical protein